MKILRFDRLPTTYWLVNEVCRGGKGGFSSTLLAPPPFLVNWSLPALQIDRLRALA